MSNPSAGPDAVPLPQELIDAMVAHAREANPDECCGVRAALSRWGAHALPHDQRRRTEPAAPSASTSPPGELLHLYRLMSDRDAVHYIVYHSHTMTEARPSPTDLRFARLLVGTDPWPYWLLVSLAATPPDVRVWRIVEAPEDDPDAVAGVKPVEVGYSVVPLPPGSERLQLRSSGDERRPAVVSESPLAP